MLRAQSEALHTAFPADFTGNACALHVAAFRKEYACKHYVKVRASIKADAHSLAVSQYAQRVRRELKMRSLTPWCRAGECLLRPSSGMSNGRDSVPERFGRDLPVRSNVRPPSPRPPLAGSCR